MSKTNKKIKKILRQKRTEDFEILSIEEAGDFSNGFCYDYEKYIILKVKVFGKEIDFSCRVLKDLLEYEDEKEIKAYVNIFSENIKETILRNSTGNLNMFYSRTNDL